jgi:hypothetical protein
LDVIKSGVWGKGRKSEVQGPTPVLEFSSGKPAGVPGIAVESVPGFRFTIKADGDPLGREEMRRQTSDADPQQERLRAEVRRPRSEVTGSVVGIQTEGCEMYTGTLIQDLMMTVERAERLVRQRQISEERELQRLFELQVPAMQGELVLVGAA